MDNSSKIVTFKTFSLPAAVKSYIIDARDGSDSKKKLTASIPSWLIS